MKGWGRLGLKTIRYAVVLRPGIEIRYPLLFRQCSVQNSLRILKEFSCLQQNSNICGVFLIRILQMRAEFQMYQNIYSSDDLYIYATLSLVWSRSCQDLLTIMFRKGGTRGWDGNSLNFVVLSTCYSMTSLLAHTVAQPTKWRFLPKNSNQLFISIFELAFTWLWVDKNRTQFQITNYFKKWSLSQNGCIISCSSNLIT